MDTNTVKALASFANLNAKGRELVAVVRIRPATSVFNANPVDILDYDNDRIWAIVPAWRDEKTGEITSLRTGMPVRTGWRDSVRSVRVGTAFNYDDVSIIYTRSWNKGVPSCYLTVRTCADAECIPHRAFGEELSKAPDL